MNSIRTNYCSLKDAFKSPDFSKYEEPVENNENVQGIQSIQLNQYQEPIVEKFEETHCQMVMDHMKSCKNCSKKANGIDMAFNDVLNLLLLIFLIWVIIYKPSI